MTSIDAADNTTAQSVPLVPHYPNKELIQFSGNDAEIPGIMHEIKLYLIRMDLHQPLLSDRACLVSALEPRGGAEEGSLQPAEESRCSVPCGTHAACVGAVSGMRG